jgi:hypothetical protein
VVHMKITSMLIIALMFAGLTSAEKITVGNYSVSFDYSKPHQIIIHNDTSYFKMETFDGKIYVDIDNPGGRLDMELRGAGLRQETQVNGNMAEAWLIGDTITACTTEGIPLEIFGNLPLYDLADFLRSLHVQPV